MSVRVRLGRTELQVSPVCYGSWQLSPRFWGALPEDQLMAAMRRAFEVGINFYDTADAYGNGLSEEVMGRAAWPAPQRDHHRHEKNSRARRYIAQSCLTTVRLASLFPNEGICEIPSYED